MVIGECFHLVNSFICSEGKHQNYPCPYRGNFKQCPSYIRVTSDMSEQFKTCGWTCACQPSDDGTKE
jgi:hypothetical protein